MSKTDGAMPEVTSEAEMAPNNGSTAEIVDDQPQTLEAAQKELVKLRQALKKSNVDGQTHRLKAAELDKIKTAQLSEQERLTQQLAEAQAALTTTQQQAQERIVAAEVKAVARDFGVDGRLVSRLLDISDVEFDPDGSPKNVDSLVKKAIKDYGLSVRATPPTTAGGATNPSRSTTSGSVPLSWDVIGKMTAADYTARQPEIIQWLAKNSK